MAAALAATLCLGAGAGVARAQAWQPVKPIELIVPYGPGGGADQMARAIQAIVAKHRLAPQPIVVSNMPAVGGGEAILRLRTSGGDAHRLLATSAALHLTPLSTQLTSSWRDLTPVALLAHDQFLLWTYADAPYESAAQLFAAARAGAVPKIGGAGSRREDHLVAVALSKEAGGAFAYVAYSGGAAASAQLAQKRIDATTGNPSDEVESWRAGTARPLCVLSPARMAHDARVTGGADWSAIPTCGEQGIAFTYTMQRGIFLPGRVTAAQHRFYVELFERLVATSEWQAHLEQAALIPDFRTGSAFESFLVEDEARHRALMARAGFLVE